MMTSSLRNFLNNNNRNKAFKFTVKIIIITLNYLNLKEIKVKVSGKFISPIRGIVMALVQ